MIYITADRLFHIMFPFKYQAYWDIRKSWKLVIGTWVLCILIGISFSLFTTFEYMYVRYKAKISRIMAVNVLSSFYSISLVIALIAYLYIFIQYSKSVRNRVKNPKQCNRMGIDSMLRNRTYYKRRNFTAILTGYIQDSQFFIS